MVTNSDLYTVAMFILLFEEFLLFGCSGIQNGYASVSLSEMNLPTHHQKTMNFSIS